MSQEQIRKEAQRELLLKFIYHKNSIEEINNLIDREIEKLSKNKEN